MSFSTMSISGKLFIKIGYILAVKTFPSMEDIWLLQLVTSETVNSAGTGYHNTKGLVVLEYLWICSCVKNPTKDLCFAISDLISKSDF